MQQSYTQLKQKEILWRRDKVLELAGDGYTEREIASQLQISDTTIHRDLTLLKREAKEHIHKYITDQVPWEYRKTVAGLQAIIKHMSKIISESSDNKEIMNASTIKMQALNLKMEMISGANLIEEGIELVERYQGYTTQKGNPLKDNAEQPT
jgi:hypothetical protein